MPTIEDLRTLKLQLLHMLQNLERIMQTAQSGSEEREAIVAGYTKLTAAYVIVERKIRTLEGP